MKERLKQISEYAWQIDRHGAMNVDAVIYGSPELIDAMEDKVFIQATNVACLPGVQKAVYAMPDAHWGYGFPIGGVAAFDADEGGVVSAGGVGFDISCGVRTLITKLKFDQIEARKEKLADALYHHVPCGVGSKGKIHLTTEQLEAVLRRGAVWAVEQGYGTPADLDHIEERGCVKDARPECVSEHAKKRQQDQLGTLGSGNHYLEVQRVVEIYTQKEAQAFGLECDDVVISIHCGSRGMGHQIGTEFLRTMAIEAPQHGIKLPDRELACAPLYSETGTTYLGAMRSAINCALANRQVITHLTREVFTEFFPNSYLTVLYDVSHNTCKLETHNVDGKTKRLYVHRKGATRSFGPHSEDIPDLFKHIGQPVLIGGSMGTCSYILIGTDQAMNLSFGSSCHGAGRKMSRTQAAKQWRAKDLIALLKEQGIEIRSPSKRGVTEEAPDAYKDVTTVVSAAHEAGLSKKVAKLVPMICIKG